VDKFRKIILTDADNDRHRVTAWASSAIADGGDFPPHARAYVDAMPDTPAIRQWYAACRGDISRTGPDE
jgi:hypothetical protein